MTRICCLAPKTICSVSSWNYLHMSQQAILEGESRTPQAVVGWEHVSSSALYLLENNFIVCLDVGQQLIVFIATNAA